MKFVITGGASIKYNLGDQAMIFTLIEYLKKTFPDSNIVLFDEAAYFDEELREKCTFEILPDIPMKNKLRYVNKLMQLMFMIISPKRKFSRQITKSIINEYKSCDYIFQLSGFSISNQMNFVNVLSRLWDISLAKELNKKIILMPQSIGPLDFKGIKKILFEFYIKKYINYPEFVFCRERMGLKLLMEYGCKKAEIEHDIVLSRPDKIDLSYIYKNVERYNHGYKIDKQKDVVVVPNYRFLKYKTEDEICRIYENIIQECIKLTGGRVFLFCHVSDDDILLTKAIHTRFNGNPDVILTEGQFNCIDAEEFFAGFAFGIVARWHANVHFIRAGLPHVVIGWAEKYHETSWHFGTEDLVFDIRGLTNQEDIISALKRVYYNRDEISKQIVSRENEIKKTFCLERVKIKIQGRNYV